MTDDNIKEVINRTSIVEIINSTVPLKKKGSNYFGLSPFKKEKTPSFSVNEEKKIFHCFSTGEHGNVIDFLIKVKGYGFKDALYELADKAGIEISYKSSKLNNIIYEINSLTKELFYKNLLNSKKHLDYISDRNIAKKNFFTPGTKIKIITEKDSRKIKPDYYLVLPWHFRNEILKRETSIRRKGTKFIFPLPKIQIK